RIEELIKALAEFTYRVPVRSFEGLPIKEHQKRLRTAKRDLMIVNGLARHVDPKAEREVMRYIVARAGASAHKRGPKPRWPGPEGVLLVLEVNAELRLQVRRNFARATKKVRHRYRALWGRYPDDTLRTRYNDALPAAKQFCTEFQIIPVQHSV